MRGEKKTATAEWIEACYRERKRLPCRDFAFEVNSESESGDEIHEIVSTDNN